MAKFKKGDLVIVKTSRSGVPQDQVLEVTSWSTTYTAVKDEEGKQWNCYNTGANKDDIVPADRPSQLAYAQEKRSDLVEELKRLDRDIDILSNYDSDEAYTAAKLSKILQAKDDPKTIENLLKELKQSNYL